MHMVEDMAIYYLQKDQMKNKMDYLPWNREQVVKTKRDKLTITQTSLHVWFTYVTYRSLQGIIITLIVPNKLKPPMSDLKFFS